LDTSPFARKKQGPLAKGEQDFDSDALPFIQRLKSGLLGRAGAD